MRGVRPDGLPEGVELAGVRPVDRVQVQRLHDEGRGEGDDDQRDDEGECGDRHLVGAEAAPEQLERRARGDLAGRGRDESGALLRLERVYAHGRSRRWARMGECEQASAGADNDIPPERPRSFVSAGFAAWWL
jgi:hypothetical protein